jgi:hypothetical protein
MLEEPAYEVRVAPVLMMPSVDGASQGTASIEVYGASPQPRNCAEGLLRDLVRCDASIGVPWCVALGDVALALGSSSAMGPGVSSLLLLGSPNFLPLPINRMWVGDKVKSKHS